MEYMGDIPEGWKWVRLGDLVEIIKGKKPENLIENPNKNTLPYLTAEYLRHKTPNQFVDIEKEKTLPVCEKDDVILIWDGSAGQVFTGFKGVLASTMVKIIPNSDIANKSYMYFFLITKFEYLNTQTSGSVIPHVNKNAFLNLPILLPPLPEQKAISEFLSSIDDKIELLHRQNKTLEEMAMTLFRQWFVEPTKDGLPDGWEERKLKDIYVFEKGIEPGSKNYLETPSVDTIRFIRVGDMLDNKADVYIKKDLAGDSICKFDDLLVSFDGTVGRASFGLVGCYSSGIRKIYSKDEVYNRLWVKHQIFISEKIQDEINMHAEGTTILHASSSIDYLSFVFPPKEKINEYDKFFEPIYNKILHNKAQIQTLEKLRDTLLPKLMSGEIRVKLK
jgi:type I restriction enzyme S subunit